MQAKKSRNHLSKMQKRTLAVIAFITIVCVVFGAVKGWEYFREQELHEQKQQELVEASGMYNAETIVLADTTPEQAEHLAELLQAKLRITEDGTYAVLYLPEGVQVEDVYENEEYKSYLSAMSLDYYVSTDAVSANNRPLVSSRPSFVVTDELYPQQNYLDYINLQDTWAYTKGAGVTVAVIDSGIDTDHPEFTGKISERSYDATNDRVVSDYGMEVIEDEDGHGTSVAGIIAAGMNDGIGITGISPEVELIVIKCETDGKGNFLRSSDLVFALAYAIECDVDVVNMSFGTPFNVFSKYTKLAVDSDIICVAAAGNESSAMPNYPAADENVIGVGALDMTTWSLADYSNYGYSLVLAPGTAYTTAIDGSYQSATGTSISSPVVTSAVALYLGNNPYTEFDEMCELLKASSVDLGILGEDRQHGFGALDIHALVCEEKGIITYEMLTDELKSQTQIFIKGHTIQYMPEPERENVVLDGWYHDVQCTDEIPYFENIFTDDVTLYASWINEDDGTAYIYRTLDDGTVEIQSYTGRRRYLTIPSVLEGKTVTSIGEYAFYDNSRLRSVILPETLTNISDGAFYNCSKLRYIEIPEKVRNIGNKAFYGCVSMSQVSLFKNGALASIGDRAFGMCGISTIHLPANLTHLGNGVFYGSTGMNSITIEQGNTCYQIHNNALYDETGTALLYYPAGLTGNYALDGKTLTVEEYAFAHSRSTAVTLNDGLISLGAHAFENASVYTVALPASLAEMGMNCYAGARLNELSFADGIALTQIPASAFTSCYYLKNVTIPAGITSIGCSAFAGSALKNITFDSNSNLEILGESAFFSCPLETIRIPASLTTILVSAFSECRNLTTVEWESGSQLRFIDMYAFKNCCALRSIALPDNLTHVGYQAFYGSGLEELTIGANLVNLGDGAFSGCRKLQYINVSEDNSAYTSGDGVVLSKDSTVVHMYPAGRSGIYTLPGTIVRIAEFAFAEAEKLTEVVLNAGLVEIGGYAFSNCTSMTTPALPASLTTIGENAFEYCASMGGTLTIPKTVISIGRFAFYQDYTLTSIVIEPESELSRIGYGTFGYCGITDFTVPGTISSMGQEVFVGCKNLLTVTFEADSQLEAIAAWTFTGAEELRQITFEEGSALKLLEARSLEGLRRLERVTLEYCTQLTNIDNYAFQSCTSLAEVTLPDSLTEIGRYAFNGCKSLSRIDLPESVTFIGRYAFNNTNNINIYFKASILPLHLEENWNYGINGYYISTAEVVTSGDWQYALTSDGKASIVAYTGSDANISLTDIDGYEIIAIGGYAFADNASLQTITLPDTLQGVYQYAFKGTSALRGITIPASVAIIDNGAFQGSAISKITFEEDSALVNLGRYAFADTQNLTAISIPDGVDAIRDYAFQGSALRSITFGDNSALTEIGRYAFKSSAIQTIALPAGVTKIDYDAFYSCAALTVVDMSRTAQLQIFANAFYGSGLTEIHIPASVEYIGEFCFTACKNLMNITVDAANENYAAMDGVLYNKSMTKLVTCPAGLTGSYTVPGSVMTLGFAAFEGSRLSEVIFPSDSQLVTLGYRVFYDCDNLTAVAIPDSVQSIDNYAFAYCDNLASVTFGEASQLSGIYKSAFYNNQNLTAIAIPAGVHEIGDYAFYDCATLTELTFAEDAQIKGIYDYAFAYSGVTEFTMPEGLLDIGEGAFQGAKLATLVCNNTLIEVGDYAFADCGLANTTVLEFPATVTYLGYCALREAQNISELTIPFLGCFEEDIEHATIFNLFGDSYKDIITGTPLKRLVILRGTHIADFAFTDSSILDTLGEVVLPDTITFIGQCAFHMTGLRSINWPTQLETIRETAFVGTNISEVTLPDSLITIECSAFAGLENITVITLPQKLESIGSNAFSGTGISEITIPASAEYIGDGAFRGCNNLSAIIVEEENKNYTSVDGILYSKDHKELISAPGNLSGEITIPEGVESIGDFTFSYADAITAVHLPSTLKRIGDYAFNGCAGLTEINLPEGLEYIGREAFSRTSIQTLVVPASVTTLSHYCFSYNFALQSVELTNADADYGYSVFQFCVALESIILPCGMKTIPERFFCCCSNLENVELPDSITSIGSAAFANSGLVSIEIPKAVTEIGFAPFSGCDLLVAITVDTEHQSFSSKDGILYDKEFTKILAVPPAISGEISIADGVTEIVESAFSYCRNLASVILPDSVTTIGNDAFMGCSKLENIVFGPNITSMGHLIIDGTAYAENFDNSQDGIIYIGRYAVGHRHDSSIPKYCYIREGTTYLAPYTVSGDEVEFIYLPDSVEIIASEAISNCFNLKAIRFGEEIQRIEDYAICWNDASHSLISLELPSGLEYIGDGIIGMVSNLQYLVAGDLSGLGEYSRLVTPLNRIKVLSVPYCERTLSSILDCDYMGVFPSKLIINSTGRMDTTFLAGIPGDTIIYCYADEAAGWPSGWNQGSTTYYRDEWHLATFYADNVIITMDPMVVGEVVQAPAGGLVAEYLWPGSEFLGWDINGDGLVDELPVTLTEDLEAHAVVKIPVTGLELSETETTMEVTDEKTLEVSYTPSYFNTSGELTWASSDETVATVDETGKITALAEGQAVITATLAEDSNVSASCTVTVVPLEPGIRLEETESSLNVGESLVLEPRYVLLEEIMDTLTFVSSDEAVATVDESGTITAIAPGTAQITISCGEYSAVYTLTVLLPAEKITITNAPESMNVDEVVQLSGTFTPENTTDDKTIVWTSSDNHIVQISNSGEVTAIAPGTVTVTAKSTTGLTAECEITVYAPIQWITLNTTVGTLRLDRTKQMEVIYEPSNTTDDKTVIWSSSDSEIASVSETGLVTGLKRGTAVITGQVGEHTSTYTVTVIGLRDGTTGITVTNSNDTAMREDVQLDVEHLDDDELEKDYFSIWELICRVMGENFGEKHHWRVYDITLSENGEHIQPDTQVDVEMPFYEGMDKEHFKIYRVEEDGTLTDMTAEIWGNSACFQTDHFSMYVIGASVEECKEHTFGEWCMISEATCTEPGEEMRECNVCNVGEIREIAALGHNHTSIVTAPTCTEKGYTTHTCECDDSYVDSYEDALGHDMGDWTVVSEPTAAANGEERRECSRCEHYESREVAYEETAPVSVNGVTVTENADGSFTAVADVTGGSGFYAYNYWLFDSTGTIVDRHENTFDTSWTFQKPDDGIYLMRIYATDFGTECYNDSSWFAVTSPYENVAVSNVTVTENEDGTYTATADVNGGSGFFAFNYWLFDANGQIVDRHENTFDTSWTFDKPAEGIYLMRIYATDFTLDSHGDSAWFAITSPTEGVSVTNVTVTENEDGTYTATANVTGGSGFYAYNYWLFDSTGTIVDRHENTFDTSWTFEKPENGIYLMRIYATDFTTDSHGDGRWFAVAD